MTDPRLLTVLEGDMLLPDVGLTAEQLALIQRQAHVIIHSASSIALLKPLRKLVGPILTASDCLASLALGCTQLECFVFVSTAYCNAHLYADTDGKSPLEVQEVFYPLCREDQDLKEDTDHEIREVYTEGSSAAYRAHDFPWGYSYVKHLTERHLRDRFTDANKRLFIIRPSIFEPAQCFPYRKFCIPMSTPHVICAAAAAFTLSRTIGCASRLDDPYNESSFDYVPVDIVVDRILAHVAYGTHGPAHAVGGPMSFRSSWERTIKARRIPWSAQIKWTAESWHSQAVHPFARLYKMIGTSFDFSDSKTLDLWQQLSDRERAELHLFANKRILYHDHEHMSPSHIWDCILQLAARRPLARHLMRIFYRSFSKSERIPEHSNLNAGCSHHQKAVLAMNVSQTGYD